jgi:hypothetical protein
MLLAKFNSPPLFALALALVFFLRRGPNAGARLRGFRWATHRRNGRSHRLPDGLERLFLPRLQWSHSPIRW